MKDVKLYSLHWTCTEYVNHFVVSLFNENDESSLDNE